jgi:hypothetical protein
VSNITSYWDSAVWDKAKFAKYRATWDNAVWDESYWGFCWSDTLDDNIARLEQESRDNPWATGTWRPGVFDKCKLLRSIISDLEK